eukprot:snap_masked-scaffold_34-processed-gene-1.64-mRNA-1 protein AED:1.00 eAED:1.00 QI:0/0/0/0/1/1/2/0/760
MNIEFLNTFKEVYQRNNKSSAVKNLRCFPECRPNGHCAQGFCGNAVSVRITFPNFSEGYHKLKAWGDFYTFPNHKTYNSETSEESFYSLSEMKNSERNSKKPLNVLIPGRFEIDPNDPQKQNLILVFNRQFIGWNYQWQSNKTTSDYAHAFRVRIFTDIEESEDKIFCIKTAFSPKFKIYSRRKIGKPPQKYIIDRSSQLLEEIKKYKYFFHSQCVIDLITPTALSKYKENYLQYRRENTYQRRITTFILNFCLANMENTRHPWLYLSCHGLCSLHLPDEEFIQEYPNLSLFKLQITESGPKLYNLRNFLHSYLTKQAFETLECDLEKLEQFILAQGNKIVVAQMPKSLLQNVSNSFQKRTTISSLEKFLNSQRSTLFQNLEVDLETFEYFLCLEVEKDLSAKKLNQYQLCPDLHLTGHSISRGLICRKDRNKGVEFRFEALMNSFSDLGIFLLDTAFLPTHYTAKLLMSLVLRTPLMDKESFRVASKNINTWRRLVTVARRASKTAGFIKLAHQLAQNSEVSTIQNYNSSFSVLTDFISGNWCFEGVQDKTQPSIFSVLDMLWGNSCTPYISRYYLAIVSFFSIKLTTDSFVVNPDLPLGIGCMKIRLDGVPRPPVFPSLPFKPINVGESFMGWIEHIDSYQVKLRFILCFELHPFHNLKSTLRERSEISFLGTHCNIEDVDVKSFCGRHGRLCLELVFEKGSLSFTSNVTLFVFETSPYDISAPLCKIPEVSRYFQPLNAQTPMSNLWGYQVLRFKRA